MRCSVSRATLRLIRRTDEGGCEAARHFGPQDQRKGRWLSGLQLGWTLKIMDLERAHDAMDHQGLKCDEGIDLDLAVAVPCPTFKFHVRFRPGVDRVLQNSNREPCQQRLAEELLKLRRLAASGALTRAAGITGAPANRAARKRAGWLLRLSL